MIYRLLLVCWLTCIVMSASVSQPTYKIKADHKVRVKMRDGVEIGAVIVRPDAEGKFPAIMSYNPYRRVAQVRSIILTASITTISTAPATSPSAAMRLFISMFGAPGTRAATPKTSIRT